MTTPTDAQVEAMLARSGALLETCSYKGQPIELDRHQRAYMRERARGIAIVKARQVGFSLILAGSAFERAMLRSHYECVVTSYNQSEATRLIRYARECHETVPAAFKRPLVVDSATTLEWRDHRGWSRIIAKAPKNFRGESNADALVDEFAFVPDDEAVFAAAAPLLIHGTGQITVSSSPMGARGLFHSIATNREQRYGAFARLRVPWYATRFLSVDPVAAVAWVRSNPHATIEERIALWANDAMRTQWDLLGHDEYRAAEEFETVFHDSAGALFSHEAILRCSHDYDVVDDVVLLPPPRGVVLAGFDPGLTRDAAELIVTEHDPATDETRMLLRQTMRGVPLNEQQDLLARLMQIYPVHLLRLDAQGMGRQMGFALACQFPGRVAPLVTTDIIKAELVESFRNRLQHRRLVLPRDRDLHSQIHSVRRTVTAAGNVVYHGGSSGRGHHHADAFWALAMAVPPLDLLSGTDAGNVRVHLIGGDDDERANAAAANGVELCPEGRLFRYAR